MAKFLIPGGLGYAGSRLTQHLVARGAERIFITSRTLSNEKRKWLESFNGKVEWRAFDSSVSNTIPFEDSVEAVIHLAIPSAGEFSSNPQGSEQAALKSVEASLLFAKEKANRLIHFSSFHVYGNNLEGTIDEETPANPTHPYGQAHLAVEKKLVASQFPKALFILRPSNSMGRPAHSDLGVQESLIFFDLCKQAAQNKRTELKTDGEGYRDFLPMQDLLSAVDCVLGKKAVPLQHSIFNVSFGQVIQLKELANLIGQEAEKLTGNKIPLNLGVQKDGFPKPFTVSNKKMKEFGWTPTGNIKSELQEILQFYLRVHLKTTTKAV